MERKILNNVYIYKLINNLLVFNSNKLNYQEIYQSYLISLHNKLDEKKNLKEKKKNLYKSIILLYFLSQKIFSFQL